METGEISVATAMASLATNQETIVNNLANLNSPSFKRKIGLFMDYMATDNSTSGRTFSVPAYMETNDFSQGDISPSDNNLDVAIRGKGFFKVNTPHGPAYTRVGSFQPNAQGVLCTPSGHQVLGANGQPIVVGSGSAQGMAVIFDPNGQVRTQDGNSLGALGIYRFQDNYKLEPIGDGLFKGSPGCPAIPDHSSSIEQNSLERPNADATEELVSMLLVKRAFEANGRALTQIQRAREAFMQVTKN